MEADLATPLSHLLYGLRYGGPLYVEMHEMAMALEAEVARLREEREGYKRDFLAASERCGIACERAEAAEREVVTLREEIARLRQENDDLLNRLEISGAIRVEERQRAEAAEREVARLREGGTT